MFAVHVEYRDIGGKLRLKEKNPIWVMKNWVTKFSIDVNFVFHTMFTVNIGEKCMRVHTAYPFQLDFDS